MKKIIISPHIDDEVLGCGGILDENTFVIYCGKDEKHINQSWVKKRPTDTDRMVELENVVNITKHQYTILDNKVNYYKLQDLLESIEHIINEIKPNQVYIPFPSYNQDHKTSYEASLTALRPHDLNHFVKKVFIYEQPHMLFWDDKDFKPNYFVPIDIDRKINLYKLMETQVRKFRSVEHLKAIAKLRGGQSNYDYAEAYKIVRWVD